MDKRRSRRFCLISLLMSTANLRLSLAGSFEKSPQEQGGWKGPPPFASLLLRAPRVSSMAWRWPAIVEVASHPPVSQIKPSLSTATQADAIRVSLLGKWAAHFAVPATKHSSYPAADLVGGLQGFDLTEFSIRHR